MRRFAGTWRRPVTGLVAGVWFALALFGPMWHALFHPLRIACHCGAPHLEAHDCADHESCPICRFATAPALLPAPPQQAPTAVAAAPVRSLAEPDHATPSAAAARGPPLA